MRTSRALFFVALLMVTLHTPLKTPLAQVLNDGWSTAPPAEEGFSNERLAEMQKAIESGEFKAITSVIIARHGRIVYEHYFDSDGSDGLRNTRSATKTITGTLIGLAIDRRSLSGVDGRVADYFRGKEPFQNPDPRTR